MKLLTGSPERRIDQPSWEFASLQVRSTRLPMGCSVVPHCWVHGLRRPIERRLLTSPLWPATILYTLRTGQLAKLPLKNILRSEGKAAADVGSSIRCGRRIMPTARCRSQASGFRLKFWGARGFAEKASLLSSIAMDALGAISGAAPNSWKASQGRSSLPCLNHSVADGRLNALRVQSSTRGVFQAEGWSEPAGGFARHGNSYSGPPAGAFRKAP